MRRRLGRLTRRAGVVLPALLLLVAAGEPIPAAKDDRDPEVASAQARLRPTPGDIAAKDPVAGAFGLFPRTGVEIREEVVTSDEAARAETLPVPSSVTEIEPGVVAVERLVPPAPAAPVAAVGPATEAPVLGYAAPIDAAPLPAERVFTPPATTARVLNVPLPKRRPADLGAAPVEGTLRTASLTPEPPAPSAPAATVAPIAAEGAVAGEPKKIPKEALPYLAILRREAAANKVPLWLAVGVGWVESKYQPSLRGTHGVVGLMQVMPSTARFQGYKGPTEKLLEPETNIVWGMKELGWDWAKSGGNPCMAIAKYKGGIATKGISSAAADYCRRAKTVTGMM